ncbi:Putative 2EXR domain-containing protein [Septoria linicola]|uniref:2EXR domain-containing protein n=1 Tax=Septoria linicola TaxID=215465 RepID=A0A9Q9AI98_9PEZI|nr:Putative 2EXR domain-containing protein [Septoria linicola]
MPPPLLALRPLQPAPPRAPPPTKDTTSFFDLPAELRIEIYKLALERVVIHILPTNSKNGTDTPDDNPRRLQMPHSLTRASRQVRNEVLPLMHASCPIKCAVTDFNFDGLLQWIKRVPPHEETHLKKNKNLQITLNTAEPNVPKIMDSMRKWLHMRADRCRPQPDWKYAGSAVQNKVGADLRRRTKRMTEFGKQKEMLKILDALNISRPTGLLPDPEDSD